MLCRRDEQVKKGLAQHVRAAKQASGLKGSTLDSVARLLDAARPSGGERGESDDSDTSSNDPGDERAERGRGEACEACEAASESGEDFDAPAPETKRRAGRRGAAPARDDSGQGKTATEDGDRDDRARRVLGQLQAPAPLYRCTQFEDAEEGGGARPRPPKKTKMAKPPGAKRLGGRT